MSSVSSKSPVPGASIKQASRQNVRVVCRVRPTNQREVKEGGITCVKHSDSNIEVNNDGATNTFNFDRIFGPESTQIEVFYDTAMPLVRDVLSGYNATIFAYGQTGTGKTHTMEGEISDEMLKGVIPRSVESLFNGVEEADQNIEFTFAVSYVEIYLEKIRDLLDDKGLKNNLTVREDRVKGVYIAGVTEVYVGSVQEVLMIMKKGAINRATAATGMNEGSSRSHSVFTITVSQTDTRTSTVTAGKLVLVDLAGSEMVRKTNASGQQLEEAKMINKSLSTLGQVINALTDEKASHIPYRDSKLTRILQDSLGGNAKTVLIVAVSPSSFNASETVSTLRFGTRAKSIENKATINQKRTAEELEILLAKAEKANDAQAAIILTLKAELQTAEAQTQAIQQIVESQGQELSRLTEELETVKVNGGSNITMNLGIASGRSPPSRVKKSIDDEELDETVTVYPDDMNDRITAAIQEIQLASSPPVPTPQLLPPMPPISPQQKKDSFRLDRDNSNHLLPKKESFRLDEGKVVVDIAKLEEDAEAIRALRDQVLALTQELDDEKQDSQRKELELRALNQLINNREQMDQSLLSEKDKRIIELEQVYESLMNRSEMLMNEKIEACSELANLKANFDETVSKLKYDLAEMEVSMQTLKVENSNLKKEITELSGDPQVPTTTNGKKATTGTTKTPQVLSNDDDDISVNTTSTRQGVPSLQTGPMGGSMSQSAATFTGRMSVSRPQTQSTSDPYLMTSQQRRDIIEHFTQQFVEVCKQHRLSEQSFTDIYSVINGLSNDLEQGFILTEKKVDMMEKYFTKKTKDLDDQRGRLEKDLKNRMENLAQLQMSLDQYKQMDNQSMNTQLAEREQQRMRSLQQRLEQLVTVHRQLLRKFAGLELESVDLRKKILLRDDRIRQLEGNTKSLIRNVRIQTEKHVASLQTYREQIQNMKREHDYRIQQVMRGIDMNGNNSGNNSGNNGGSPYKLNGGMNSGMSNVNMNVNQPQSKTLRGGGKSLYNFHQPSVTFSPSVTSTPSTSGMNQHSPMNSPSRLTALAMANTATVMEPIEIREDHFSSPPPSQKTSYANSNSNNNATLTPSQSVSERRGSGGGGVFSRFLGPK